MFWWYVAVFAAAVAATTENHLSETIDVIEFHPNSPDNNSCAVPLFPSSNTVTEVNSEGWDVRASLGKIVRKDLVTVA